MRKIFLLSVPLIVLILIGVVFWAINFERPPDWQADLDRYLQYKNADISGGYKVVSAVEASSPWNFTPEMSLLSVGESVHYQTDIDYSEEAPDQEVDFLLSKAPSSDSLIALPFPPDEIWCIYLEGEDEPDSIVLVALHQDLYNADYIIHEIADGLQAEIPGDVVQTIDCDME